jgi:ABC-type transporter Mla subunit MlaD
MLIAILTILFLGGSSTGMLDYIADTQDNVKAVMVKDERRTEALATLKAMKKITNARNKQVKRASKELRKVIASFDQSDDAFGAIWSGYFATVKQYDHELLDLRYELKEQLTREEWEAVFSES